MATGEPIVYTSADSVFQIAAHQEIIPLEELYAMCQLARQQLRGVHGVARVIARPFVGQAGHFTRTAQRKDFSLPPSQPTLLDEMKASGMAVVGIGKIEDLFAGCGLTDAVHTRSNAEGMLRLLEQMGLVDRGALLVNLVDFDMLWGHRNDPRAYARGLEDFDRTLDDVLSLVKSGDLLIIAADHGNDPTTPSTDHSREYVPLLVYGPDLNRGIDLGIRSSFADVAATVAEGLDLQGTGRGQSFWTDISPGPQ
jgi:phosphopentomutase